MIYVVIGRRELGKTTMGYYLAKQAPHRIVFDPRAMFAAERNSIARYTVRSSALAFSWSRGVPLRVMNDDGTDTAVTPVEVTITPDEELERVFSLTTRRAEKLVRQGQSFALLIDEFRFIDKSLQKTDESLNWILRCAERSKVDVIVTAHRPVDVHPDIRAIADHYMMFRMTHASDLNYLADQCGSECAAAVASLEGRQCVHWDDTSGGWSIKKDPAAWFTRMAPEIRPAAAVPAVDDRPLFDKPGKSV